MSTSVLFVYLFLIYISLFAGYPNLAMAIGFTGLIVNCGLKK